MMAACPSQRVRVFARTRPTPNFASESILINDKMISVHLPVSPRRISNQVREWNFGLDGVLHNSSQEDVYSICAQSVVTGVMEGVNGTIFAYGQTGAGKTYTMSGESQYRLRGIIPRTLSQIFTTIREKDDCTIIVRISCLEIYNENLTDLLAILPESGLLLSENEKGTPAIKGLSVRVAENEEEALNMFFEVEKNRLTGERTLNKQCSRSHVIFTIHVENHSHTSASSQYTVSKLHLVDLAGSECLSKSESTGAVVTETIYINKSLSFLEQVVIALADKRRTHIPYRHCKLTQVLKDCLGGNCNTVMIANIWGELAYLDNTVATLRFSERIMGVVASPQPNIHYNPEGLIQKYEQDIKALKEELAMQDLLHSKTSSKVLGSLTEGHLVAIKDGVKQFIAGNVNSLEFNSVREIREIFVQFKEYINSLEKEHQEKIHTLQESLSKVEASVSGSVDTTDQDVKPTKPKGKFSMRKAAAVSPTVVADDSEDTKQEMAVSDGQGFSIGQAPATALANTKFPLAKKRISFLPTMNVAVETQKSKSSKPAGGDMDFCVDDDKGHFQPSTPPTRPDAFELFKKGRGKEINRILLQNKDLLQRKKKAAYDISCKLNELKEQIDEYRKQLEGKKKAYIDRVTTSDGKVVMDSEEYHLMRALQKAKEEYKSQYAILEGLRADIPYCDQYTQQSRQKLMDEFDSWYKSAFIGDRSSQTLDEISSTSTPTENTENSRFKDLQQLVLLQGDPSTMAFYYAQLRTGKRGIVEKRQKTFGGVLSH